jgi:hypothetical protein
MVFASVRGQLGIDHLTFPPSALIRANRELMAA